MSKRQTPEAGLVAVCLEWLRLKKIFAWRNNTGALRNPQGRSVPFGLPGSSDILGLLPPSGRFFAVECKIKTKVTAIQDAFLAEVTRAGGLAVVVYSLEELIEVIEGAPHD